MEIVRIHAIALTLRARTTVPKHAMVMSHVYRVKSRARCDARTHAVAQSAVNLVPHAQKIALGIVSTSGSAACPALCLVKGCHVRDDAPNFWSVAINVQLYVENYAPHQSSVNSVRWQTSKGSWSTTLWASHTQILT